MVKKLQCSHTGLRQGCRQQQAAAGTSRAILWQVSLNGSSTTSSAQQRYVRQTNTCTPLAKNNEAENSQTNAWCSSPTVYGVIFICLHRRSFHMFTISKHPLTCVCFRKTLFHVPALARHPFSCVPQQTIIWHKWLPKEIRSFHLSEFFGRTLLASIFPRKLKGESLGFPPVVISCLLLCLTELEL